MGFRVWLWVCFLIWVLHFECTHQLQSYQTQVLLQVRKHLEYPSQLQQWAANSTLDFCTMPISPSLSISCENNLITELKITGTRFVNGNHVIFNGFAIDNVTLSKSFSIDSLFTTLSRLTSLRVVCLVALGIWGPVSDKIHRLYSLEVLELSDNFLYGEVPSKISVLWKLRSLVLDGNYFNGSFPDWFDSLPSLAILSLKSNSLTGHIPSSISRIGTLTDLALSNNRLSGRLPDFRGLGKLQLLDLRVNRFESDLPMMPKGLVSLLLNKNSLTGEIPKEFGDLNQLQHLDMSYNALTGTPPPELLSLPSLSYLNLASNMLSGSLPGDLQCGEELGFVDISNNRLTGGLPACLGTGSDSKRVVKNSGNCLSVDALRQHQASYCKDTNIQTTRSRRRGRLLLFGLIGGGGLLLILLIFVFIVLCRRYYKRDSVEQHVFPKVVEDTPPQPALSVELLANARFISEAAKAGKQSDSRYHLFSLEEIEEASKNFDTSTILGEGSLGKVYKGRLSGAIVAIRSLSLHRKHAIQSLKLRLDMLSKLRHPHLVTLLGHCIDVAGQDQTGASKVFLVYEYMPNGSFRSHLAESLPQRALRWSDRLAILIAIAKAVHFLHTGVIPPSLKNRLTTSNILLDEHRVAKLSDYGMSIITEEIEKIEEKGDGFKAWQKEKLEDDVFNFGFILLEALVGPVGIGKGEAFLLNEMASFGSQDGRRKIVDPIVLTTSLQESLSIVISITNKCISPESTTRPSFEDVLWNLQYAAQVQASSDSDQKSDATSQSNS
ncbi:putative inactive leucine-rich repeat receptor-like protein [Drosera capensis]